jgi:hypothetical protein
MLHDVAIVAKDFLRHHVAMATKPTRAPTAHIVPFGLRLQPELKTRLEKSATSNGRSLNAEITARLERSFDPSSLELPDGYRERLEEHAKEYGRTLDEEIINRIYQSFEWDEYFIPIRLQRALHAYRKRNGLESREAIDRLVTAGLHAEAPAVLILNIEEHVDIESIAAVLDEARKRLPPKTAIVVEQKHKETPAKKTRRKLDI